MSIPVFTVEAAFASGPLDASYSWDDITEYVGSIEYSRGRNYDYDRVEAGRGATDLLDDESVFDPRNTASPFYPNVKPLKPFRQYATLDGTDYPCCLLFAEGFPRRRQGNLAMRSVGLVDAFDPLAVAPLRGATFPEQTTGARVTAVLDQIGWPAGRRSISTGLNTVQAVTFTASDTTKALQHLQQMAEDEDGIFFIDREGIATFIDRRDLLGSPFNESQATFSENPGVGEYLCSIDSVGNDKQTIQNDVTGTRSGGTAQNAQDATSIAAYGQRSRTYTSQLSSDAVQLSAVQYRVAKYKDPLDRIDRITVMPGNDSDLWALVLTLDIGARITVIDTPPNATPESDEYIIQRLTVRRQKGSDAGTVVTYSLWPADINAWFVLDDPTYGLFDANRLGY